MNLCTGCKKIADAGDMQYCAEDAACPRGPWKPKTTQTPTMVRFRHKGCRSEVIRYTGEAELVPGMRLISSEWLLPNGKQPDRFQMPLCPDCGRAVATGQYGDNGLERIPEPVAA